MVTLWMLKVQSFAKGVEHCARNRARLCCRAEEVAILNA